MSEGTDPLCDVCRAQVCLADCPNRIANDETYRRYQEHILIPAILASCETPFDFVRFDEIQSGKCMGWTGPCGRPGKLDAQNTAYEKLISNYICLCEECWAENEEHWASMWAEYNSGRL